MAPITAAIREKAATIPSIIMATIFHDLRKTKWTRIRQDWLSLIMDANKGGKRAR